MATRKELEKRVWFRLLKVAYFLIAALVVGFTLFVWNDSVARNATDTSKAYFVCNHAPDKRFKLTDAEKDSLSLYSTPVFSVGSLAQTRINKECYSDYSGGNDPDQATEFDISLFREMEQGADGRIYTIQGIEQYYDWNLLWLIKSLLIQALIFFAIAMGGLYISGGKEAMRF